MKNQDIFALLQTAILAENKEAALFLSNQLHKGLASSDVEVKPLFTPPTSPPQETKPLQAPLSPPPIEKAHVPVSPPQAPRRRPFALGPSESFPVKLDKRPTNPKKGEILFFDFLNQNNKRVQIFVKKPNAASIFFETLRRKLKIGVAFHELMEAYFGLFCRTYPNHGLDTRGMFNRSWERYLISNDLVHKKSTLQKGALVEFIDPNFAEELKKFNFLKTI